MSKKENLNLDIIIKKCLEATQLENNINYSEKNKTAINSIKEFTKTNKSKLKMQQMFKSERHNVFNKVINKIALSSNDDKRMQSIETYAYGTSKDLVSDEEEIKCNNIIKRYKK